MMIRVLTVSALMAVLSAPAFAQESGQTNPETRQTDQSEEDWRKSRKKRDSGDIFEDIVTNPNSTGTGGIWGGEVKAIDRLDPESRRHLNRLRAKALAEAGPGEPIDAAYEPSEAAKSDEYIARQEEVAWEEMVEEANSGLGGIAQTENGGGDQPGNQSGGGQAPEDDSQTGMSSAGGGQSGSQPSAQTGSGSSSTAISPLRGGSAASASDILNQIKGRGSASGNPVGQDQGEAQADAQADAQGQSQSDAGAPSDNRTDGQVQSPTQAQSSGDADSEAVAENQTAAQNKDSSQSAAEAQAEANSAAQAAAHAETISPLERLKRDPVDRNETGGRTSASDYLKKKAD